MTPKTWEEVVEIAAEAAFEQLSAGRAWDSASAMEREERRIEANAALHALRAAGLAVVPREATEAMVSEAWDAHADGAPCELIANPRQIYEALNAALTAGEIKPEGE